MQIGASQPSTGRRQRDPRLAFTLFGLFCLLTLSFFVEAASAARGAAPETFPPELRGIDAVPRAGGFSLTLTTDKTPGAPYLVGEHIFVHCKVSEEAYLWLYNISSAGQARLVFPNKWDNTNLLMADRVVTVPDSPDYHFIIAPPAGTEYVVAVAVPVRATPAGEVPDPPVPEGQYSIAEFSAKLRPAVSRPGWVVRGLSYAVQLRDDPDWATLTVRSPYAGTHLYLDGNLVGDLPQHLGPITEGRHQLIAVKEGYQAWVYNFLATPLHPAGETWWADLPPIQ